MAAADSASAQANEALERLCRTYWLSLYACTRRRGWTVEDAQDLTQEFLAELIARRDFSRVDRARGRFRSYLLACLKHFLDKDQRDRKARKRGGGQRLTPFDLSSMEEHLAVESVTGISAEQLFDQR